MKKVTIWGWTLLLVTALATQGLALAPAQAEPDPKWEGTADYEGFMAIWNENDPAKKAANAEKFIVTFKTADPIAVRRAYMMMLRAYHAAQLFAKVVETADKQATIAPALSADDKKTVLLMGMDAATRVPNNPKVKEYADKILAGEPNNWGALVTLSNLLANTLPADEAGKQKQFDETLVVTRRALAITTPAGIPPATLKQVTITLRNTEALMLLNQKKYPETIAAAEATIKLDKKNAMAWYLTGLALVPSMNTANKAYRDSVDLYNKSRDQGQLIVDQLKADSALALVALEKTVEEVHKAFANAVAAGGPGSAEAMKQLQQAFTGTPAELDALVATARTFVNS